MPGMGDRPGRGAGVPLEGAMGTGEENVSVAMANPTTWVGCLGATAPGQVLEKTVLNQNKRLRFRRL